MPLQRKPLGKALSLLTRSPKVGQISVQSAVSSLLWPIARGWPLFHPPTARGKRGTTALPWFPSTFRKPKRGCVVWPPCCASLQTFAQTGPPAQSTLPLISAWSISASSFDPQIPGAVEPLGAFLPQSDSSFPGPIVCLCQNTHYSPCRPPLQSRSPQEQGRWDPSLSLAQGMFEVKGISLKCPDMLSYLL